MTSGVNVVVQTGQLRIGMYVAELDRPWLGTPFLLQGFLIESDAELDRLRELCTAVVVDPDRSIIAVPVCAEPDAATDNESRGFLAIARQLRGKEPSGRRQSTSPPIDPDTGKSRLEAELLYSAPIVDDVYRALRDIRDAIGRGAGFDLDRVSSLIGELAAGVARNPDAMMWLSRLRRTDEYSYDHALDVSVHLMVFGRFIGQQTTLIEETGFAGLMQDIGKLEIDPAILAKPGALSDAEYEQVKSHVGSSLELLAGKPGVSPMVLEIVGAHHERFDGSGYPSNVQGELLMLSAEMAGLVDTYCAMTRHRVYSAAISSQRALEALVRLRGTKFRTAMVDQFIQCLGIYPIGSLVELNTGEVAVVIQQNQVRRLKPRVLVLLAEDKSLERRPRSLDLMLDPSTPTGEAYRIRQALPPDAYGINPAEFYLD